MPLLPRIRRWIAKTNPRSRLGAARAAAAGGDDAEARALFSPLLELNAWQMGMSPLEFSTVLGEMAECSLRLGKSSEAEGICRRGLSETGLSQRTGSLRFILAKTVAAQGRLDEAEQLMEQAVDDQRRASGKRYAAYTDLCLDIASELIRLQRLRQALRFARRGRLAEESCGEEHARSKRPAFGNFLPMAASGPRTQTLAGALDLEIWLADQLDQYRLVAAANQRLLSITPVGRANAGRALNAWLSLASASIKLGQYPTARTAIESAATCTGFTPIPLAEFRLHTIRGYLAAQEGHYSEAIEHFSQALADAAVSKQSDLTTLAQCNLGQAMAMQGKVAEAEPLLRTALESARGSALEPDALHSLAQCILRSPAGPAAAEPLLRQAIGLRPDRGAKFELMEDLQALAELLLSLGRSAEAVEEYKRASALAAAILPSQHPRRLAIREGLTAIHSRCMSPD